jgi:hypothetical protein
MAARPGQPECVIPQNTLFGASKLSKVTREEKGTTTMSHPVTNLLSDDRAAQLEEQTALALSSPEGLTPIAREFALATLVLLKDRQARCELAANAK